MSFSLDIKAFVAKAKGDIDKVTRAAITEVATKLIGDSPVGDPATWKSPPPPGYVGGRFKGSWDLSLGEPSDSVWRTISPDGSASIGRIVAAIPDAASGKVYYICNNTPYAQALENGHSYMQAPLGIVELVVFDWDQIVKDAIAKTP